MAPFSLTAMQSADSIRCRESTDEHGPLVNLTIGVHLTFRPCPFTWPAELQLRVCHYRQHGLYGPYP
jgi:hypothetical protein